MINIQDIRIVHVEASSRCNSHCPMCSRYTADGYLQPGLTEEDLTPELFYKLFTPEFVPQLVHVYFSGVYGDPCLNKNLPEFVNYLMDHGCKGISIDTNGGYRNEDWWSKLARPGVLINFAIDGASTETLSRYRINVNYDKVITNVKSFVAAGGLAQWNFIVFKHNEHEVELAQNLAKEIGIDFRIKVTQKFKGHSEYKIMKQGQQIDVLEPPVNSLYRHSNVGNNVHKPISRFKFNLEKFKFLNGNTVTCKTIERKDIFLSASGLLFPCCYVGTYTHDSPGSYQFNKLYSIADFDLKTKSVTDILEIFKLISNKWSNSIEEGNLVTCLSTCGNEENTTLYHGKNHNKENIMKDIK